MRLFGIAAVAGLATAQFPAERWERATPESQGVDSTRLNAALDLAGQAGNSYCVTVHRNGKLIGERYWNGNSYESPNIIWSTSKAIVSTLVGMAELSGNLRTQDFMSKWIDEWAAPNPSAQVTIDQSLRHNSGRYYDLISDFVTPQLTSDSTPYAISLTQQFAPGTRDQYNQMAMQALERVLSRANGEPVERTTARLMYETLRFEHAGGWQNTSFFINNPMTTPQIYGGYHASCADLARFGTLWLHGGEWNGQRIFSPEFFRTAMSQPSAPFGLARRYGNWGAGPTHRSTGLGDQFVAYNQATNMVITRTGLFLNIGFNAGNFVNRVIDAIQPNDNIASMDYLDPEKWIFSADE